MTRLRRFESLEKARPTGSDGPAQRPGVADRFGSADPATPATAELSPRSQGTPKRFEAEPAGGAALRLRELDGGQPFVRCACCRADGHVSSVVGSHCGADLTTREQRAYNEALWRQRQAEQAEQREQLANMEAARAQADREAAEARRRLEEEIREARRVAADPVVDHDDGYDALRGGARSIGRVLGAWLRREVPNRIHRIALVVAGGLALGGLVVLVVSSPTLRSVLWTACIVVSIVASLVDWFRRSWRG